MTTTPHDALCKATFEQPAKAAELLRSFLPPALSARIDWSTLVLESGSLVVGLWVRYVEKHRGTRLLPPVLPVVVHHDDKAWAIDPQFSAVVDCPADLPGLAAFIPDFRFVR